MKTDVNFNTSPLVKYFINYDLINKQINNIIYLQNLISKFEFISKFIAYFSLLGSGKVILIILCYIKWFYDPIFLWRLPNASSMMLIFTGIAKATLKGPRPYFLNDKIKTLDPTLEKSFGFPSGHTSGSISIYGLIAYFYAFHISNNIILSTFVIIAYISMCSLIAFSRIYCGAHFHHDVIGGFVLGCFLLYNELSTTFDHNPGSFRQAMYLLSVSLITFFIIFYTSIIEETNIKIDKVDDNNIQKILNKKIIFKLVQESISGIGFTFGLAITHLLEKFLYSTTKCNDRIEYRPISVFGAIFGIIGMVIIATIIKLIPDNDHKINIIGMIQISSLYSAIMILSLYIVPLLFAQSCN